jgi:uncharacterized surface protein with fasciclin (FAS1) repeats
VKTAQDSGQIFQCERRSNKKYSDSKHQKNKRTKRRFQTMKHLKTSLLLSIVVLLLTAPLAMAAGHETIVDIAVSDGRFDTLVAAVTATGLADALSGGEWTVFAPTDDAFAKLGLNEKNIATAFS